MREERCQEETDSSRLDGLCLRSVKAVRFLVATLL
jgi:hypothetical protein